MAQIDERARSLNQPEPEPEPEPDEDEDEGDEDEADDEDQDDDEEAPAAKPARDRGAPALSAGLLLGAVLYTVVIQLIRGGTPQLKGWISAKFINVPWTGAKAATEKKEA